MAWSSGQRRSLSLQGSEDRISPSPIFFCQFYFLHAESRSFWREERKQTVKRNEKRRMSALAPALRTPVYTHVSRKRVYSRKDEEKRRRFDGGGSNSGAVTRKEKMVRRSQEREFKSCMNSIKWSTPSMCKACNIVNNLLYKCLERKKKQKLLYS